MNQINNIIQSIANKYEIKNLGESHFILGCELNRDRSNHRIYINEKHRIINLIIKANMQSCDPAPMPGIPGDKLSLSMAPINDQEHEQMKQVPYRQVIGILNYLAANTRPRPDISFATHNAAQFAHNPGPSHWKYAKHIVAYLKGTINHELILGGNCDH